MMRILAFGNSHVGAWRDAWPALAGAYPEVEMTFFGAPIRIHARYELTAEGRFTPRGNLSPEELDRIAEINGCTQCDLAGHDCAVWIGHAWHPERAAALASCGDPPGLGEPGSRPALGSGFVSAALDVAAEKTISAWPETRQTPKRPLIFGRPIYAETCQASTHILYADWRAANASPDATRWFLSAYRDRLVAAAAAQGLRFLAPPDTLQTASGMTAARFLAQGGGRVNPAKPNVRGDHSYMNADYGAACIRHFLAVLSAE